MVYKDGRPVFYDLPQKGYQDNPIVDWLTLWYDERIVQSATTLESFWQNLDPMVAPESYLDYLAFLCGLSGKYWDVKWTVPVKRSLISLAHSLWSSRGTLRAIKQVLNIQLSTYLYDSEGFLVDDKGDYLIENPEYTIWTNGALRLSFTLPATFGKDDLKLWVRLPLKYQRSTQQFKEAQRTLRNYAPAIVKSGVCFERFYLGFSVLGDPLFDN
jgi:phage tail-like protein